MSGGKDGKIPSPVNHGFQVLIVHIGYVFQLHIKGCTWINQSGCFKKSFRLFITKVRNSGQISLGKKFADKIVMLDEIQAGIWIVKLGQFIPNDE